MEEGGVWYEGLDFGGGDASEIPAKKATSTLLFSRFLNINECHLAYIGPRMWMKMHDGIHNPIVVTRKNVSFQIQIQNALY
jgi:hypothetical protein